MTTQRTTSTRGSRRPPFVSTVLGAGIVAAALVALMPSGRSAAVPVAAASTTHAAGTAGYTYGWPVKPFDREHPVRAVLGDPRTIFNGPPTVQALLHAPGSFSFHQGIDISAANGTAVYPVMSGVVTTICDTVGAERVVVDSGNGHSFEYWHVHPLVAEGAHVTVDSTVLGRIVRPAMHVHLTEYLNGRVVNPLAAGHMGPYTDTTAPKVTSVTFRPTDAGRDELPGFIRGKVELVASAIDLPTKSVPGIWNSLPTTPARLTWRIETWNGKLAGHGTSYDHRSTVPPDSRFWSTYARGTYQNMSVFSSHYSYLQGGCYLFRLTPSAFDTRTLRDGVYNLVVTASDIRGNSGSLTQRFTVHNRAGWIGS